MEIIRNTLLCMAVCLLGLSSLYAQDDVRQQIRAIKMDQSYLKAEANDSLESEALKAAALELIYNYNAERTGRDLDTVSIELIRPSLQSLVYARGSVKRVLVFVELAVADSLTNSMPKPEKTATAETQEQPEVKAPSRQPVPAVSSYGDLVLLLSNIEMVSEAVKLLSQYKDEGKISEYGQLRSLSDISSRSFLLIYDRERTVRAILSPEGNGYNNVKRNCPDDITNYSGCGSLWFR